MYFNCHYYTVIHIPILLLLLLEYRCQSLIIIVHIRCYSFVKRNKIVCTRI